MPNVTPLLHALLPALGIGLLIGAVRERSAKDAFAGLRTHGLAAVLGAVALGFGAPVLWLMLGLLIGLVLVGYWRSSTNDPGVTGEIALVLTALLGALTLTQPALAVGLGVVVAGLLYAKTHLHRLARDWISEDEVRDGLILLAAALVVLPLVPDRAWGPYGAINPALLWRLVVLVMAIGAAGHIALRLVGQRWGLAIAGFFAGYVSSTAATAGFGQRVRETPALLRPATSAAMLANLASLTLFVPILLAVSPTLLPVIAAPLLAAAIVLAVGGLLGLRGSDPANTAAPTEKNRMFQPRHAIAFAALVAVVWLVVAALNAWLGARGALVGAALSAAAELHAAVSTLGQLFNQGVLDPAQARLGLLALLAVSALAKSVIAWASGGRAYGLRVAIGLLLMVAAAGVVVLVGVPAFGETAPGVVRSPAA